MKTKNVTIIAIAITSLFMISSYMKFHRFQSQHAERKDVIRITDKCTHNLTEEKRYEPNGTIVLPLVGGLGNCLWLYSSLYGLAKKTNRRPIACYGYDIRRIFSHLPGSIELYKDSECKYGSAVYPSSSLKIVEKQHLNYDTSIVQKIRESSNPHIYLCCYLQNLGYFVEYIDEIRTQFIIKDSLQSRAQDFLRTLLKGVAEKSNKTMNRSKKGEVLLDGNLPVFVTIHVRRANMLDEKSVVQPGPSYFKEAMGIYRKKYGDHVIFLVATDDLYWCKANIQGLDVHFTGESGQKSREDEFAIAVACNHSVISVGTFGWWIGFLTGGDVIYVRNWVKGGQGWNAFYHPHQFFPHSWQGLTLPHPKESDTQQIDHDFSQRNHV